MENDKDLDALIQNNSLLLTKFCVKLCENKEDAEDLFQETWVKALKGLPKYNSEYPFKKWLIAIAANCFKNRLRTKKRRPQIDEYRSCDIENFEAQNGKNNFGDIEFKSVMDLLKPKYRIVIVLYYMSGYSVAEISAILNISVGAVKSRMFHARTKLKEMLNNER